MVLYQAVTSFNFYAPMQAVPLDWPRSLKASGSHACGGEVLAGQAMLLATLEPVVPNICGSVTRHTLLVVYL